MVCVIPVFCVYSEKLLMFYGGTVRNIQFYYKNKFEKLVHLVGFYYMNFITMHGHLTVKVFFLSLNATVNGTP